MNSIKNSIIQVLPANWAAPYNIKAFTTLAIGGHSQGQYAIDEPSLHHGCGLNLATHVDDDLDHVYKNRRLLYKYIHSLQNHPIDALSMPSMFIVWLQQVHGTYCANLDQHNYFSHQYTNTESPINTSNMCIEGDASFSSSKHIACAVLTADCLPIVVTNKQGTAIAAIHAGWKGLLNGIIENTLAYFMQHTQTQNEDILIWMGPAIGKQAFEIGEGIMHAFMQAALSSEYNKTQQCFHHIHTPIQNHQNHQNKTDSSIDFSRSKVSPICYTQNNNINKTEHSNLYADLYDLAKIRMQRLHIAPENITGGNFCTYFDHRFYSYRRQSITGRMATIIHFA